MAEPIAPTEPAADTGPAHLATTEELEPAPAHARPKRRWLRWVIVVPIVLGVLVGGFFAADAFARSYATDYVHDRVIEVLHLDPKAKVDVALGDGSVILQAITGGIHEVTVDVKKLTFGDLSGDARLTATDVPLDGAKPLGTLRIVLTVSEANVQKLAGSLSGLELKSISLGKGVITIGSEFTILFFTIPVAVDLAPAAADGGISFDPQTVYLGEQQISVDDLRNSPQFSGLAASLLASQTICVAQYLPTALAVDDVDVVGSNLVVSINGDGTALDDPGLASLGHCPA